MTQVTIELIKSEYNKTNITLLFVAMVNKKFELGLTISEMNEVVKGY